MKRIVLLMTVAAAVTAQQNSTNPLLPQREALPVFRQVVQLMEATGFAVPGLPRAAAPVMETAKQHLANLETNTQNSAMTFAFLSSVRSYLALAESVPKPYPFPDQARKQFADLRDAADRIESHFRALLDQKERQLRSPDRDNLRRYAEANDHLPPPAGNNPRVLFLGDSITDGWRLNEYFTGRDFVNRGISGQITGEMLGRMKADVIDLKPRLVVILAGTNDIARGVPLNTIENNLTMIGDLADFHRIKPLFASVLPVSDYHKDTNPQYAQTPRRPPATILELNRWIKTFCAQRNFVYVDYFPATVDSAGMFRSELADDGLHPNPQGYRIMAPIALAAIDKALGGRSEASAPAAQRKKRFGVF